MGAQYRLSQLSNHLRDGGGNLPPNIKRLPLFSRKKHVALSPKSFETRQSCFKPVKKGALYRGTPSYYGEF